MDNESSQNTVLKFYENIYAGLVYWCIYTSFKFDELNNVAW